MAKRSEVNQVVIEQKGTNYFLLKGNWVLSESQQVSYCLNRIVCPEDKKIIFNLQYLMCIHLHCAYLLLSNVRHLEQSNYHITFEAVDPAISKLLSLVKQYLPDPMATQLSSNVSGQLKTRLISTLHQLGVFTVRQFKETLQAIAFFGEICSKITVNHAFNSRSLKQFLVHIDHNGVNALPIVGLLSFLIGVILAYQMGLQLKNYGGDIFLIDFSALALLREFAPLMTAIIFAGRTGAAFTAELANMTLSEEIIALEVMGVATLNRLVLPRICAACCVLPLLTVWADLMGLMGAMCVAEHFFHISVTVFMNRLVESVDVSVYYLGLIKTPIFALVIAIIGCYHGLSVSHHSSAVGHKTTISVVQSIFLVIVIDALFSILFSWKI